MKRVLICEDEPLVALDLEQMVYDSGHVPIGPARGYGEAMELAEVSKPDVAIIDIHLADGLTGTSVARALAERGTRIIVLSSVTDVLPGLAEIPHVFITKPVDPEALVAVLQLEGERAEPAPTPLPLWGGITASAAP